MDLIPATMQVSEARANLTEVVNAVRLQDRTVRLTRRGTPQAAIVPMDVLDLIEDVGGINYARDILGRHLEALKAEG
jgi:prevent-host-death family protein